MPECMRRRVRGGDGPRSLRPPRWLRTGRPALPAPAYVFLGACLGALGDLAAPLSHRPCRGAYCVKRRTFFVAAGPGPEVTAMSHELLVRHTRSPAPSAKAHE